MWKLILISLLLSAPGKAVPPPDTLAAASVAASWKLPQAGPQTTTLSLHELEAKGLSAPRDLSAEVPNLHIPDYGSSMTSSIYLRGLGSRIDNPVIGLYIDDIPVLDKNAYDFSFMDIRQVQLLRGPQGTLFGRNSLAGVLSVQTLSADAWQGVRARVEGGSFGTVKAGASLYRGPLGVSLQFAHSEGWYSNTWDGSRCDGGNQVSLRVRYTKAASDGPAIDHIFSASALSQKGYPYRRLAEGILLPVSYNDPSGYRRITATDGLRLLFTGEKAQLRSVTALHLLLDRMYMDNDFTPAAIFTLEQTQRQGALTQEILLRPHRGDHVTGFFGFLRYNALSAPVTFWQDGINDLILSHANEHLPDFVGKLYFQEESFPITSDFGLLYGGAALFHESRFHLGEWVLTAGLRLDYEGQRMQYDSRALIHFYYIPVHPDPYPCETRYQGVVPNHNFQLLPKVAARRTWGKMAVTASVAKGYKAGGFNTQIFSDILQNQMMTDLMDLAGVKLENGVSASARNTRYKPESCWNFEVGGRYVSPHLNASLTAFYIDCRNQQITVFPPGKNTGRMMANAGRSFSTGVEAELRYRRDRWGLTAAYGFTEARFREYHDGNNDYSGNHIPYCPQQTVAVQGDYTQPLGKTSLRAGISWQGTGRIWWDEANSLSQGFYGLLGGHITWTTPWGSLYLRGSNLLNHQYNTFYFKSMGNAFFQQVRPRSAVLGITLEL